MTYFYHAPKFLERARFKRDRVQNLLRRFGSVLHNHDKINFFHLFLENYEFKRLKYYFNMTFIRSFLIFISTCGKLTGKIKFQADKCGNM